MTTINSRADLERLRDTDEFEPALKMLHGTMTVWELVDEAWVAREDLTAVARLGYTKQQFLDEIDPFDFPAPAAPPLPPSQEVDPLAQPLTKRQVTRALILGAEIEDPDAFIENAIGSITDPAERALALSDWRHAPYYVRSHPLFQSAELLTATGLTEQQVDALWALGIEQPR